MSPFAADAAPLGQPYWRDGRAPGPALDADPPERVDLAVVGAGYTGLSAAIAAADAGASVAALDAGLPGAGASTRNGGMFGAHPRLPYETVARAFGEAVARGVYAEAGPAFAFTRGLIEREGIDCDLAVTGRIQLAWTREHHAAQRRLAARVAAVSDTRIEALGREALAAEIATPLYAGALRFPDHAGLDPAKLHAGLLAAALRRGVAVVGRCPVESVARAGTGFRLRTPRGALRAERVVLATNGYTRGFAWVRRRVFPLPSYIVATEKLAPDLIARLAPGRRMMVETRVRHSYFRIAPDGSRILFGGRAAMVPIPLEVAAARLRATMAEVWPELTGVRLSHAWSGMTGYSFGHLPHVGVHDGMAYALGYSGSGVALAPYLGAKAAWTALGDPRGATAYAGTRLGARAWHFGGPPRFLAAADLWYRHVVDRRENAAAARDERAV